MGSSLTSFSRSESLSTHYTRVKPNVNTKRGTNREEYTFTRLEGLFGVKEIGLVRGWELRYVTLTRKSCRFCDPRKGVVLADYDMEDLRKATAQQSLISLYFKN